MVQSIIYTIRPTTLMQVTYKKQTHSPINFLCKLINHGGCEGAKTRRRHHEESPPNNKLHHPFYRQLRRSAYDAPLLPPRRQTSLVFQLARDRRLAHHPLPYRLRLLPPFQDPTRFGKQQQAFLHETTHVHCRRRHWNPDRPRRLPLRLRHGSSPRFDLFFNHCLSAGFHGGVRFPFSEAKVHFLFHKRRVSADDRSRRFGYAYER